MERNMKISFITTVLNEEKTIGRLLDSLLSQSRKPDEIVIVDGGSRDKTVEIVSKFATTHPALMIRIIRAKGTNRARGRNEGIRQSTGDIIAVSDAGCVLEENWLKNITTPFKDLKTDVVAGYYQPVEDNVFQKCLACYTSVVNNKVNPQTFLPSSRSIAFKKNVWEKAGGYPGNLDYCEDLIFATRLKKNNSKIVFMKIALVYWPQRKNLWQAFIQFFHYASGDVQASYWPHLKKIALVYFRYLIGIIMLIYLPFIYLLISLFVYFSWAVAKNYRYVGKIKALFYLPLLQVTADLAVMVGAIKGILKKIYVKPKGFNCYC